MPEEIELTYTTGAFSAAFNWSPTSTEKDDMAAALDGTYILSYDSYVTGLFFLGGPAALYKLNLPAPYSSALSLYWLCNTDVNGNTVRLESVFCDTGNFGTVGRHIQVGTSTNNVMLVSSSDLPSITDYCDGDPFSLSKAATARFIPDTLCGSQSGALQRVALFDATVDFAI